MMAYIGTSKRTHTKDKTAGPKHAHFTDVHLEVRKQRVGDDQAGAVRHQTQAMQIPQLRDEGIHQERRQEERHR